jgi:peroxiredoxin
MQQDGKLKSLFVVPAAGVNALLCVGSVVMALSGGYDSLAWWGAAIANLPLPLFLAFILVRPPPRTSEYLPIFLIISLLAPLLSAWEVYVEGVARWYPFAVAVAGSIILYLYVFWYSRLSRIGSERLAVGSKLPQFELKNSAGTLFNSSSLAGNPALLLFYRGSWCPFCMAQIQEIADQYQEFHALGAAIVMISPQSSQHTQHLARKFDVPIEFLVDEGNLLAEELNIAVDNGVPAGLPGNFDAATVLPTVVVAKESGTIIFSDQTNNYRLRPEPDVYLAILRRAASVN